LDKTQAKMKKITAAIVLFGLGLITVSSCEKDNPAETVQGNYTGVIDGEWQGIDTLKGNYPVFATEISKNKVELQGSLFSTFQVLVTKQGINVDPVATDDNVLQFLYQGDLKELTFTYAKDGDTISYTGTKP
jgi:hypothetical protein